MGTPQAGVDELTTPEVLAFADYVSERYPHLLRAAYALTRGHHTAEDLLQTALIRVGDRWDLLRDQRAADAYVRRTMANLWVSWGRRASARAELAVAEVPEPAPGDEAPGPALSGPALWELVCALPAGQRAAVVLRYYEQMTEAETADALGLSRGTVKSSTSRGLASLRRRAGVAGAVAGPLPATT